MSLLDLTTLLFTTPIMTCVDFASLHLIPSTLTRILRPLLTTSEGRYRPSTDLVCRTSSISQVFFVEKSAGNSDIEKLTIVFFVLFEQVSSTFNLAFVGLNDLLVSF